MLQCLALWVVYHDQSTYVIVTVERIEIDLEGVNRSNYKFYHYLATIGNSVEDKDVPNNCKNELAKIKKTTHAI